MDEPVEAYWDANVQRSGIAGQLIGQGTIPETNTAVAFNAQVPADAAAGEHQVTVCWRYTLKETWYYKNVPFDVTEPSTATHGHRHRHTYTAATPPRDANLDPDTIFAVDVLPVYAVPAGGLAGSVRADRRFVDLRDRDDGSDPVLRHKQWASGVVRNNSLPLVAQKNAAARIYLKYQGSGSTKAGIPVRLHLFAAGVEYIVNTSGTAHTSIRQDLNNSANVWFNVDFANGTTVSYYAEVDPDHLYLETNESNNRFPMSGTS